jgi:hypothetical protein
MNKTIGVAAHTVEETTVGEIAPPRMAASRGNRVGSSRHALFLGG